MKQVRFKQFSREAKIFLWVQFFLAGYYTWPFWYGFATERLSSSQFGLYFAFAYIVGLIAEVPTGAFADKYGRKKSALIGALMVSSYGAIAYFGRTFEWYLVSGFVSGVGAAFLSGSLESLVFESKGMTKKLFRSVMQSETIFWQSGLIISTALGGILFGLHPSAPFIAQGASFLIAAFCVALLTSDSRRAAQPVQERRSYKDQNIGGAAHLLAKRALWPLIAFGAVVSVVVWAGVDYLNEAAMIYHGFEPASRGLILAGTKLVVMTILLLIIFRKIASDRAKLTFVYGAMLLSLSSFSLGSMQSFLVGFLFFNFASSTAQNYIRPMLHDHLDDKFRATAMSTYSFLCGIVIALSSVLFGWLLDSNTPIFVQRLLLIVFAVFGTVFIFYYNFMSKEKST